MNEKLRDKIRDAINSVFAENGRNTPDLILAEYLPACPSTFDKAVLLISSIPNAFKRSENMLVSSHTISIWYNWGHVPSRFYKKFTNHPEDVLIVFVPKVIANGVNMEEFLKRLDIQTIIEFDDGFLYVNIPVSKTPPAEQSVEQSEEQSEEEDTGV